MTTNDKTLPSRVGLLRRLAAILYDMFLLFAVLFFASLPIMVPFNLTMEHPWYPLYIVYIYAVSFIFYGWFWTHGGQTLGMKTWRIRVEQSDGSRITWPQALMRFIVALISIACLGLGFIWCLFNKQSLSWHDLASRTRLVRT